MPFDVSGSFDSGVRDIAILTLMCENPVKCQKMRFGRGDTKKVLVKNGKLFHRVRIGMKILWGIGR